MCMTAHDMEAGKMLSSLSSLLLLLLLLLMKHLDTLHGSNKSQSLEGFRPCMLEVHIYTFGKAIYTAYRAKIQPKK